MTPHQINYRIHSHFDPYRQVEVHATPEEIARFVAEGYLVRERLFSPEQTGRLKQALDALAEEEFGAVEISRSRSFGGLFLRHLMDKKPEFLELFRYAPTLSVARAVLGPQVQVLPMTARISYPDQPNQETEWHFHQRVIPEPLPPFFCRPHVLDCLIYLDELNDANGALCVVPGSHNRTHEDIPADSKWSDLSGQVMLRLPAGSCVMVHGALWHRALPTTPQGTVRRLLILPYAASWLQLPSYGVRPENGLMRPLYVNADQETRELLGVAEGLY
jgi:ectoine hydroxylase-related dioxygenase (phytanoyl-CoA dioxygenase family)